MSSPTKWSFARITLRLIPALLLIGILSWCSRGGDALREVSSVRAELQNMLAESGTPWQQGETLEKVYGRLSEQEKNQLLYHATEKASLEALKWLVVHGAKPAHVGAIRDLNLLQLAARSGSTEKLAYFLDQGFQADVHTKDGQGLLHLAAKGNMSKATLALLSKKGLQINDKSASGETPLHGASFASTQILLDSGAQTDAADAAGRTPLHHAALEERTEVVNELVARGASVFITDKEGRTALHFAAMKKSEPLIDVLLAAGAMKSARDIYNMTPRDLAEKAQKNHTDWQSIASKL
jgi:ankyrin repeat protein